MTPPVHVFLSHQALDKPVAREIATFLFADDAGVWFDEWSIRPGDSIPGEIQAGMASCTHFIVLWSQHAARSPWVARELEAILMKAIQEGRPRVIPVLLDMAPLPPLLEPIKYLEYDPRSPDAYRRQLVKEITGRDPRLTITKAIVAKYHDLVRSDNQELLGLRACPSCGSIDLRPGFDALVDGDCSDGVPVFNASYFTIVICKSCGWSGSELDLNPFAEPRP
jgi:hypothetical protein